MSVCTLTIGDLIELMIDVLKLLIPENKPIQEVKKESDIIFIEEVMRITKLKKSTIYSKVSKGEIPYLSGGRPLTFSRQAINSWIEMGKPTVAQMKADNFLKKVK